jgi:hypothetical protein
VIRPVLVFVFGCLVFWGILAYPAFRLWGVRGLSESAVAAGLCFLPSLIMLVWSRLAVRSNPQAFLWLTLGSTLARMGTVLGFALLLGLLDPVFREASFWAWVLAFYLFTLVLDVVLSLKVRPQISAR